MNVKELIAINAELMEQISALQTLFQLEANFWNDHEISKNASMAKLIEEKDKEINNLKEQLSGIEPAQDLYSKMSRIIKHGMTDFVGAKIDKFTCNVIKQKLTDLIRYHYDYTIELSWFDVNTEFLGNEINACVSFTDIGFNQKAQTINFTLKG